MILSNGEKYSWYLLELQLIQSTRLFLFHIFLYISVQIFVIEFTKDRGFCLKQTLKGFIHTKRIAD